MKTIPAFVATLFLFFSPTSFALQGSGKIVEVRTCVLTSAWKNIVQFKLSDGNWFGVYGVFHAASVNTYNDTVNPSMIMMAFSADYTVNVNANHNPKTCGGVTSQMIYLTLGDYIHITKD